MRSGGGRRVLAGHAEVADRIVTKDTLPMGGGEPLVRSSELRRTVGWAAVK